MLKGFTFRELRISPAMPSARDFVTDEKRSDPHRRGSIGDYVDLEVSNKANEKYDFPANVTVTVHEGKTVVCQIP